MSSFLYSLGRAAYRRRGRTLAIWLLVLVLVGGVAGVFNKPFDEKFTLPGTQSQAALDSLSLTFPQVSGTTAQLVFATPDGDSIRDARYQDAIEDTAKDLESIAQVESATSPFDENIDGAISDDDGAGIISLQLRGAQAEITEETKTQLEERATQLVEEFPGSQAQAGGEAFSENRPGVSIVEAVGVVVALVVLLLTLGSFRAAGMPLATALLGVGISMAMVIGATAFTLISSTTPMLALMLGLAVGIDYALFIVSRHRDQLADGMEAEESAAQSIATAGSAVIFAGLTVMIALGGLAVANIPFLTTMGIAAALAVAVAVLIALTLLPAMLGFAGDKLRPKQRKPKQRKPDQAEGTGPRAAGGLARVWVRVVTKWPIVTILIVVAGLGVVSLPAQDLRLALPDNGSAPAGSPARTTYDLVSENFGEGYNGPLIVTAEIVGSDDPLGVMDGIADDIRALPGVADVPLATPNENADTGIIQVIPESAPDSEGTKQLVADIRGMSPQFEDEYGVETAVTGFTAVGIDVSDRLGKALLPFGILVVGLSLVLLTMVFRSIAVPLKATIGYLLSVAASFGAVAAVFEYGWFADLLNVEDVGPVISFLPILLMGVLFGLAMDYEVFLVARIREDYVHGKSAHQAIESGFVASSRVVAAAAIIMFAVFASFVPTGEGVIKAIALGLAVGVFVDAFVVRMTLVPAVLALLGRRAWWLPKWLDRVLPSFDVEGESLHHQLSLASWPSPDSNHRIYAEGLTMRSQLGTAFSDVDIALQPGELLVIEGQPGAGKTSLMLSLSGRMQFTEGRAKTAGFVLPEQAGAVRSRTGFVAVRSESDVCTDIRRANHGRPDILFIDDADRVQSFDARQAIATLIYDVTSGASGQSLVIGVGDAGALADLLPPDYLRLSLNRTYEPLSVHNAEGTR
ncbi:efflux RND transporter permease subunit [Saxibacter everestensis]|uniref:Efflux RND transporter permease subunit n=1 Tax=Saxibacter everestensis TaxID=2909229 RepID=A0ABY8QQD5_9MICO|nr:efflux RND transporter permease subunit [Brevibacteriaceae bacterium ZFBP1038]